jgi:hypothetical protein
VFTGQGKSRASKSWWPTDSTWQANAERTRWTEDTDHFFETRLKKLQAGGAEPLTFTEWRQQIRGSSTMRRINKSLTLAYEAFVETA